MLMYYSYLTYELLQVEIQKRDNSNKHFTLLIVLYKVLPLWLISVPWWNAKAWPLKWSITFL